MWSKFLGNCICTNRTGERIVNPRGDTAVRKGATLHVKAVEPYQIILFDDLKRKTMTSTVSKVKCKQAPFSGCRR